MRTVWAGLVCASALACGGDDVGPIEPAHRPRDEVVQLQFLAAENQKILGGRRSPEAFRVYAENGRGDPVPGAIVDFDVTGTAGGILSQPRALTDEAGVAETYLLEARSGFGLLSARVPGASAQLPFDVERAPGKMRFEEATGAVGLPGQPHPDSVVRVQVFDSEGAALGGVQVWFAGPRRMSRFVDTTDAQGWASTIVRESQLTTGDARVFAFILSFPELTTFTFRPVEAAAERVVLVSIDGLRADVIDRHAPATLSRLAREGAFTRTARTVFPSLTAPAHLSLFASVPPEGHGILGDDIEFTPEMAQLEPLFRSASRNGLTSKAFMAREGPLQELETALRCRLAFGFESLTLAGPGADRVAEVALPALQDPGVEMVFIHLGDPDRAGHAHGWSSPEYAAAVFETDAALSSIVDAITPGTLLIVTSDHGGGGAYGSRLHGSASDQDVQIPVFLWGSRVVPGADPGEVSILDLAPTALWALGFVSPRHYEGRPLLDSFR